MNPSSQRKPLTISVSVVSDLVRASMGSAVAKTVTDEDLDRHIGEIIRKQNDTKGMAFAHTFLRAITTFVNLKSGG